MRRSIATVCLSGDLKGKLEAIAAAGFEGFELFENDLLSFEGTAREVRQMAQDLGLSIVTLQPFRDFEGLPEPQRSRALLRAERKMDVMEQLGADLFFVCSSTSPHSSGSLERIAEDLYELGQRASSGASGWATRPWPGRNTSTTTATPGRWCAGPTTPQWALF